MQVGNRWTYDKFAHTYNFRPIDSTYQYHPDSLFSMLTVEVTRQLLIPRVPGTATDSILVTEFRTIDALFPFAGYYYYTRTSQWLLMQGYVAFGYPIQPRPAGMRSAYRLDNRTFGSLQEIIQFLERPISSTEAVDTMTREYPSLTSIKYPLTTGDQWTFRPQGRPWRIDKRTGASRWDAQQGLWYYEVRWLYDMNGDGVWDENISVVDRISTKGLLGRTIELLDLLVTTPSDPEGVGIVDIRDQYTVTSIAVP